MFAILFYLLLFIVIWLVTAFFGYLSGFLILITLFFISLILSFIIIRRGNVFAQYFGLPGRGKTTIGSAITYRCNKKKRKVYSNVPIAGAITVDLSTISVKNGVLVIFSKEDPDVYYVLQDCVLIIDESGLEFNNRSWKSNFTENSLDFFKKHRHYNVDIYMFSQCYSDSDKKLRDLTNSLYIVKRSFFPFFVRSKRIDKKIGIDKITQQIIDAYKFVPLSGSYYFMPKYWKKFDSFEK